MDRYRFGNKICALREEQHLTQKEFAQKLGVSDKAVSKWENGKSLPRIETLEAMAELFGVDIATLLCDEPKGFDLEQERLRLNAAAKREQAKKLRRTLLLVLFGVSALLVVSFLCERLLFSITKNGSIDAFSRTFFESASFFFVPLTAFVFLKTFLLQLYRGVHRYFNTPSDCVTCENKAYAFRTAVHFMSSLFAIPPLVIAVTSDVAKDGMGSIFFLYIVHLIFLALNAITEPYADTCVVCTKQGFFKGGLQAGIFHTYCEIQDFTSNIEAYEKGISDTYKVSFTIGDERYKLSFSSLQPASQYFGDKYTFATDKTPDFHLKVYHYIILGICFCLLLVGFITFMAGGQYGTKSADYTAKATVPSPLTGQCSLLITDDTLFVYSENQCALNAFQMDGTFLYAVSVPRSQNGESCFYLRGNCLYIIGRHSDNVYRYDKDGNYLGKFCNIEAENEDEQERLCVFDRDDNLLFSTKDNSYDLICFDEARAIYTVWDAEQEQKHLCTYNHADNTTKQTLIVNETAGNPAGVLQHAVFAEYGDSATDGDGNIYDVFGGKLYRNDEVLYRTPFWKWYSNTYFASWITFAVGMLGVGLLPGAFKKRYYRKNIQK